MLTSLSDMANVDIGWEVEGIITVQESVKCMLQVVEKKTIQDTGTFWTWEGNVGFPSSKRAISIEAYWIQQHAW